MSLELTPLSVQEALPFVAQHHSHLKKPKSALCAVGVSSDARLVCVALLSHPRARGLLHKAAEVTRVASDGTTEHAASMALGAIRRAGLALGWRRLVSYTFLGEPATLFRAAGWWPVARVKAREWDTPSRARPPSAIQEVDRIRWETGPAAKRLPPPLASR